MALPGVEKSSLKSVMSHPQALAQCEEFIRRQGLKKVVSQNTAGSAKHIAENNLREVSAIASPLAAKLYGLNVLDNEIADDRNNYTRFIFVSRKTDIPTSFVKSKTSIIFCLLGKAGTLVKALSVFMLRDIDLIKIESRPGRKHLLNFKDDDGTQCPVTLLNKKLKSHHDMIQKATQQWNEHHHSTFSEPSNYDLFYLDFAGSIADIRVYNALLHLSEIASFVRVLGSYQSYNIINELDDTRQAMVRNINASILSKL
eukprot:TRINITY_DN53_c0_g1_i2.p1 TRINITY_DN53_c0_g1~~TRINITY_DN53_c0_g1_i2.p1  ORF type:complete len:257 (-),score=33.39 TRINITY_DN53_c0_g1_i2:97-867(-)